MPVRREHLLGRKASRSVARSAAGAAVVMAALVSMVALVVALGAGDASAQDDGEVATRIVVISAPTEDVDRPLVVDRLAPQTVLRVQAGGFDSDTTGRVVQCVDETRCRNALPVRFDEHGSATFEYLVTDEVGEAGGSGRRCRLGEPRCTIELRVGDSTSVIDTVFVDEAPPPGSLGVDPRTDLLVGDTVTVTASGFAPGAELTVLLCAAPSTSGSRCGAPGPVVALTIGGDGSAEAEMTVPLEVGSDRVACGRRVPCRIVVSSDQVGVWARPVTLAFAEAPRVDYHLTRVVLGLAVALGLGVLAAWLIRSTDWSPPPEADSSPIDDAEYADLDLEAEQFVDTAIDGEPSSVM